MLHCYIDPAAKNLLQHWKLTEKSEFCNKLNSFYVLICTSREPSIANFNPKSRSQDLRTLFFWPVLRSGRQPSQI